MLHNEEPANDPGTDTRQGSGLCKLNRRALTSGHRCPSSARSKNARTTMTGEATPTHRHQRRRRALDRPGRTTGPATNWVGTGRLALIAGLPPVNTGDGAATGPPTAVWILRRQIDSVGERILFGTRSCFLGNSSRTNSTRRIIVRYTCATYPPNFSEQKAE